MKTICLLGSTGSIGTQALEIIKNRGFEVDFLSANSNIKLLEKQAREYKPRAVCIYNKELYSELKISLADTNIEITSGMNGLLEAVSNKNSDKNSDIIVFNALVGIVGLRPTLEAINSGKTIALANKETLVAGGRLVMKSAREKKVSILPVDSEHSAIFQCLQNKNKNSNKNLIKNLILTASGGPFFGKTKKELENITPKEALNHPNWNMGAKISIDSATLMNKGLEVIEASWLFDKPVDNIEVVIHRESVIHSAVEFIDNSVIAQLGVPDMKIPIQYALTYPERAESNVKRLNLIDYGNLSFLPPDNKTFVCLEVCRSAMKKGGLYPCIINGVNEAAVEMFLKGKISFNKIGEYAESALDMNIKSDDLSIDNIIEADKTAREYVLNKI